MDAESVREVLLRMPLVVETMQWGDNLVYWVGDKAVGGKMFALMNLDRASLPDRAPLVISFSAGPERFAELVEREGVVPAPYMARIFWVALERWDTLPPSELRSLLTGARDLTYYKLPQKTKYVLALPPAQLKKLVSERRKALAAKSADKGEPAKKASVQHNPGKGAKKRPAVKRAK